jgi:hypothetical protein
MYYREPLNWFIIILIFLQQVNGHGRMDEPPARNAAWRYGKFVFSNIIFKKLQYFLGFDIPANYDDVGLNCGGLGVQKSNGIYSIYKFQIDF